MSESAARQRVLVVDDEPLLCDVLVFYLEDAGYETLVAHSGHEALELLSKRPVDAVVSDIRMPSGSGIELLDSIKATMPGKPVVLFMTAHSDITVEEAYHKG